MRSAGPGRAEWGRPVADPGRERETGCSPGAVSRSGGLRGAWTIRCQDSLQLGVVLGAQWLRWRGRLLLSSRRWRCLVCLIGIGRFGVPIDRNHCPGARLLGPPGNRCSGSPCFPSPPPTSRITAVSRVGALQHARSFFWPRGTGYVTLSRTFVWWRRSAQGKRSERGECPVRPQLSRKSRSVTIETPAY